MEHLLKIAKSPEGQIRVFAETLQEKLNCFEEFKSGSLDDLADYLIMNIRNRNAFEVYLEILQELEFGYNIDSKLFSEKILLSFYVCKLEDAAKIKENLYFNCEYVLMDNMWFIKIQENKLNNYFINFWVTNPLDYVLKRNNFYYLDATDCNYIESMFKKWTQFLEAPSLSKLNISEKQKTYIAYDKNTGYYKIGKSVDPKVREKTLQSEKPTIEFILVCDKNVESELHSKYKANRIRGEWFSLSENDILDIISEYGFEKMQ